MDYLDPNDDNSPRNANNSYNFRSINVHSFIHSTASLDALSELCTNFTASCQEFFEFSPVFHLKHQFSELICSFALLSISARLKSFLFLILDEAKRKIALKVLQRTANWLKVSFCWMFFSTFSLKCRLNLQESLSKVLQKFFLYLKFLHCFFFSTEGKTVFIGTIFTNFMKWKIKRENSFSTNTSVATSTFLLHTQHRFSSRWGKSWSIFIDIMCMCQWIMRRTDNRFYAAFESNPNWQQRRRRLRGEKCKKNVNNSWNEEFCDSLVY